MPTLTDLRFLSRAILFTILAGALFGHAEALAIGGDPRIGYIRGGVDGALISAVLGIFEIMLRGEWGERLRQAPFMVLLATRVVVYSLVIRLSLAAGLRLVPSPLDVQSALNGADIRFSFAMAVGFSLLLSLNRLLGRRVFFNFVAGRYHRPRVETRALLFIDMVSSTSLAERLGELRFLTLLNRFVADLSHAITREGGEIHKYMGDEVIATWRLGRAEDGSAALRACFAASARLVARAGAYQREFGLHPEFRAALHSGPVVMGELGSVKMEIALIGDTMNTAARIHEACRETGHAVLASSALIDRLGALPAGIVARALGPLRLRGKEAALALYALEAVSAPDARSAAAG